MYDTSSDVNLLIMDMSKIFVSSFAQSDTVTAARLFMLGLRMICFLAIMLQLCTFTS